ncbi:MAG: hypothetical protein U1D41_11810 [Nitrosomonas sp.]|uniref:hypothetical protein n=1 Tax=Nitrosomonas sp. TaxID=42353 RepID=UPI0027339F73|nr:hypothetical protein [Nitrosomonas sp.]MDP1934536.1 hypothetical protein [Nitrosomonas sp.]MDP3663146.1 hypothetical protein [Nitrosomonas sp.]MDZ4106824.1 hypothetical protein [Nitrosomonas sp.]
MRGLPKYVPDIRLVFAGSSSIEVSLILSIKPLYYSDKTEFLANVYYNFFRIRMFNRPLKNVFEAADARQKQAKKRSLCVINEHFEPVFNTVAATQIVFQRPVKNSREGALLTAC